MWKAIFKTTLIAGCLDISAACLQAWLVRGTKPATVLQYIASGAFGKAAFSGSAAYLFFGLLFHFCIAFACTLLYFLLYPKLTFLQKNTWLSALLVAVAAWVVTTRIIIPLSQIKPAAFDLLKALQAVAILYACIGLPVCIFAKRYYNK